MSSMNLHEWYYNKLKQIEALEEKVLQYEIENKVLKQLKIGKCK